MEKKNLTLGKIILDARKKKGWILRECAALILKEDRTPISIQYLSDLEKNRRNPSEHTVEQLALVLEIPVEYLYVYAEMFPTGLVKRASQDRIVTAFKTLIKVIGQEE